jgi:hypothetical protein
MANVMGWLDDQIHPIESVCSDIRRTERAELDSDIRKLRHFLNPLPYSMVVLGRGSVAPQTAPLKDALRYSLPERCTEPLDAGCLLAKEVPFPSELAVLAQMMQA